MNLTRLIEETGRRIRLGRAPTDRLTNTEVKRVLETAVEVLRDALIAEGRVEIQHFAVIEVQRRARVRWTIRPAAALKAAAQDQQVAR